MKLSAEQVEAVRSAVDLLELVRERGVQLKKSAKSFRGNCPFHEDANATFYVWPEKQRFKCYDCKAAGDVFSFTQRLTRSSFVDAVKALAAKAGVSLDALPSVADVARRAQLEVVRVASAYFVEQLWNTPDGRHAREYLVQRGVTHETAHRLELGWAPASWRGLTDVLRECSMLEVALELGLVATQPTDAEPYDAFRGRLMFPLRDVAGDVVGFGGRLLTGVGPKYINSHESPLFVKSRLLFGIDVSAVAAAKSAVLCEGYFDATVLQQLGVTNTAALCSTTVTADQAKRLVAAGAKDVVLLLDGDTAGVDAVERNAAVLFNSGLHTRVAQLPAGFDPDTFALTRGRAELDALLGTAPPLAEYLLRAALPAGAAASFEEKMAAFERLRPALAQLKSGVSRSVLVSQLAQHWGVAAEDVEAELRRAS